MDYVQIMALIAKGLTVVEALYEAGRSAGPAIQALKNLTGEEPTPEQIADTEALLDSLIAEFNIPITDEL